MFGMCINDDVLDYLIGVEDMTGDIHVIRYKLTTDDVDSKLQMAIIMDYKVVDKDAGLRLSGDLYIECKFDGSYKGVNTYSIGILGTYFHPNAISSYYFAKFSTMYNLTEYYVKSEDPETMEVPRKIVMDTENRRVYLAIEINKNKYHGRTVYAPGAQPGIDNSNVAIVCYQWTHGVRQWVTLVGSEVYSDVFADLDQFENNVYVVVNGVTPKYSTNSSQTDIFFYRMRSENGVIEYKQIYGSPKDDKALDMGVSFNGVYIYAMINGPFLPHRDGDKQWKTIGNDTNLAIIHIDFEDLILDIEAFDYKTKTSVNFINPYPMKFFLIRSANVQQNFILVTHRTNEFVDRKGGIYITYFEQPSALFVQTTGCPGIGCSKCSGKRPAKCLECMTVYQLFQHGCNEGQCPEFTYMVQDRKWASQKFCKKCHYSCKTCQGPREDQCKSCCINGACGQTKNRDPILGKCLCPVNTAEINGICNTKCITDLGARLDQKCLTNCPTNSYPMLKYDDPTVAQESTQPDPTKGDNCERYSYNLQFTKTSMGLPLPGPPDFKNMPEQFTVAFWVLPKELNSKSFFVNLFNRAYVWSESANYKIQYKFINGATETDFVSPDEKSITDEVKIELNKWTFIAVSQRQIKTSTSLYYEIIVAIAKGNFGNVNLASYTGPVENKQVVKYSAFKNLIYIGAQSDLSTDTSFSGSMKEVQLYTSFRGVRQMDDSFSRTQRLYSYDDNTLVAYWKLTETYTQADPEYTINDYSYNMNSISYSRLAKPSYPQFIYEPAYTINLCYLHDVKNCYSLDYSGMPPVATSARSYIRLPTLDLKEYDRTPRNLVRDDDDMIFYVPQNTDCNNRDLVLAKMNFTVAKLKWEVKDDKYNPMYLKEGVHYQQCYYIAKNELIFNLAQVYVAFRPRTVDPSNGNIYNRSDNTIQFMTGFGDQAFGDVLRLARECDNPNGGETEFVRSNVPSYDRVGVTASFNLSGTFYFCWYPRFTQMYLRYPIYESIHNLYWKIQYEPVLKSTFRTEARVNQDMVILQMDGTFLDGDLITMAWRGLSYADCNPSNFMGQTYMYNHSSWPALWIGHDTGIRGIQNTNMDDLQICWKPGAEYAPSVYIRIKKEDMTVYQMRVFGYLELKNQRAPELISFDPPYGSSIIMETDRIIKFNFKSQSVIPCKAPNGILGQIRIFRGAVKKDGNYVKMENSILWENKKLDQNRQPDPFQQGDLICTQTGQCSIILSLDINRMKAGEVYFLTFYSYSFLTYFEGHEHYLFSEGFPVATPAYDHFFMCRSFNIFPSDQLINGQTVVLRGVDLREKTIKAKYSAGGIDQEIFYTKAINLRLKVFNTDQYQCTFDRPTATVAMEDVYDDYFVIRNLELRECNSGQLFADIEFLRGIRDDNADFSYLKAEKIYNIQIGSIGCHPSCKVCNGTLETNCMICTNPTYKLFMGTCLPQCPVTAPEKDSYSITYHNVIMTQVICTANCPFGKYSDTETRTCLQCNQDCQTCNSSIIASCLTCNPIKYLYNGMCVSDCPQPHHENNFTDYLCHQKTQPKYLQVKILSLGFINRIPKDKTVYLKADINNTGGGNITSILWQQMEPDPNEKFIFSQDDVNGNYNVTYQLVRLNNNILMKMGFRETVKVNVTVTNTAGDIAYDIYEFFLNDSPFTGDMSVAVADQPTNTLNFKAVDHLIKVNLTKWYDSSDDKEQKLRMKIHMIKSMQVGNTIQTQQFTVTDLVGGTNVLYFRIPPIYIDMRKRQLLIQNGMMDAAVGVEYVNVTYCVSAIDIFNAISSKCATLQNVENKISFLSDLTETAKYLQTLNFTNNITNILFGSNIILQTVQPPMRPNTQPQMCTGPLHCNFRGVCSSQTGVKKCECDLGYFGTYCDFKKKELPQLQGIAQAILDNLLNIVRTKYIVQFDNEVMGNVVRALTNHPDLINDENYYKILELLTIISSSDTYAHQPYDVNITTMIMEAYNNAQLKMAHSFKVRKAMKDFFLMGIGMNMFFHKTAFSLKNDPLAYKIENSDAIYFTSDSKKTQSLIAGVNTTKVMRTYFSVNETDLYKEWSRSWGSSFDQFCGRVLYKLQPSSPSYTFRGVAFEVQLMHRRPGVVKGTMYIKSKDAYWNFPPDMFDQSPGVASPKHEIKFKLMKHILNPYQFEADVDAYLESNVTSIQFYSLNNKRLPIKLSPTSPNFIQFREPFNATRGIAKEWLRCMLWDPDQYKFVNDNQCGFQFLWEQIPCADCDKYNQMNTTISLCRCKEIMSSVAVVYYQVNATTYADGFKNSIYTDFFAMAYWQESFGFLAVVAGVIVLITGHILIWLLDGRLRRNLVIRLREKARNFELTHSASMLRKDGLFIKIESKKDKKIGSVTVASTKKTFKEVGDDQIPLKDDEEDKDGEGDMMSPTPGKKAAAQEKLKRRKKVLAMKKKIFEDEDEEDSSSDDEDMLKQMKGFGGENQEENDEAIRKQMEALRKEKEDKKALEEALDNAESSSEEEKDLSLLNKKQRKQYLRHQEILKLLKSQKYPHYLYHELLQVQLDQVVGMTQTEFRKKVMSYVRKLPEVYQDQVRDYLGEIKGQLYSTDEELYRSMKDVFKEMKREREQQTFKLKNLVINGSLVLSLFYVTSILSPRHVRWQLLMCNVTVLWFICAVFFNNTKDPLVVPDFSTEASSLAFSELWISFMSPFGSMILMFVVSCFLKMPNSQFVKNVTLRQLEIAVIEYQQEQSMRFFLGYIVVMCVMGYIYYYLVNFTAMFGWKVSWVWYYTCMVSMVIQFVFVDPVIALFHWIVYRRSRKFGRICQKCRSMSQGYNEAYDLSDGELEERRKKEEEEKAAEDAKKKGGKKKGKKAGLFGVGETQQNDEQPAAGPNGEVKADSGSDNAKAAIHDTAEEALNGGGSSDNKAEVKSSKGGAKKNKSKQD